MPVGGGSVRTLASQGGGPDDQLPFKKASQRAWPVTLPVGLKKSSKDFVMCVLPVFKASMNVFSVL
jgi:hypothetical protein